MMSKSTTYFITHHVHSYISKTYAKLCWNIPPRASQINTDLNNRGRLYPNTGKIPINHRFRGWEKPQSHTHSHTHSPQEEPTAAHASTYGFMRGVCARVRVRALCKYKCGFIKHTRRVTRVTMTGVTLCNLCISALHINIISMYKRDLLKSTSYP